MNSILREFDEEEYRKMLEEESRREGFLKGEEAGRKAGLEKVNRLNKLLAEQSRTDDIIRAAVDEAYQKKLFEEYGI